MRACSKGMGRRWCWVMASSAVAVAVFRSPWAACSMARQRMPTASIQGRSRRLAVAFEDVDQRLGLLKTTQLDHGLDGVGHK